ncbi:cytochrome c oxidase assembly protein [Arthrobacter sp. NPDC057009]|uniref:cytochrome c oxidase assembly protein n=1 Tax=Arthrobacter sp. NPDC057009 TaxID=3345996 RepID=UPI0036299680
MNKSRTKPVAAAATILACGLLALLVAYSTEAGQEAALLDRTGAAVIWGLPVAKLVFNAAAAGTLGPLVLALVALPPNGQAYAKSLSLAGISAVLWTVAAAVNSVLTFHSLANLPLFSDGSGAIFISYLTDVDAGRRSALTVLITAIVALLCFGVQSQRAVVLTAVLGSTALFPLALNSHAAGGGGHADSTVSVVMHMAAAAVWVGGLAALVLLRRFLGADLSTAVRRYSTLALLSFVALAVSGAAAAWAGVGTVEGLASPYGFILVAKTVALVGLGACGALHRRWVLGRLEAAPGKGPALFIALAVTELAVMAAASGMAAALARTRPPSVVQGAPAPETVRVPGFLDVFSNWKPDPLWIVACGLAVILYVAAIRRVRLQGGHWPLHRTATWGVGITLLFLVTNGGIRVYQEYLISTHVLTQMLLMAVVPLLLVSGAPLTLARLAVRPRPDGTVGAAVVLDLALRPVRAASSAPYVPAAVLAAVLAVLYYTPLLEYSSRTQFGYQAMALLALFSGCLFFASLAHSPGGTPAASLATQLVTLAAVAGLYAMHGWALAQQADQLPDSRREAWVVTASQPWDQPVLAVVEPAGAAMWMVAGCSLCAAAVVLLRRVGQRPSGSPGKHRDSAPAQDLVMSPEN